MASAVSAGPVPCPSQSLYRFTVEQYHQLLAAGVLRSGDRVELLHGYLVEKMTHHPPAAATITIVQEALTPRLPSGWIIRIQLPITVPGSEPEPDLAVVMGPARRYLQRHPTRAETGQVIEVADSTVDHDREVKVPLYASARIPVYWIVNIPEGQIEVFTQPRGGRSPGYRDQQTYRSDDLVPLVIAGQDLGSIPARELLP